MSNESPFTLSRFEYEEKHLYYLPRSVFSDLENSIPTYLVGTRGTGKTTLLKALNWEERIQNESLQDQLHGNAFGGRYIGVYLKLPEIQLKTFENWLAGEDENLYGLILGLYLDLVWTESLSNAVAELLAANVLHAKSNDEHQCVAAVLEECSEARRNLTGNGPLTLRQLANTVRVLRESLEKMAQTKAEPQNVVTSYPLGQIGSLGRSVARKLADLCNQETRDAESRWHFKICMDEGECLSPFQQRVMNTVVRLSAWPAFPVVSYVRQPDDITTTLVPKLTLQKADRQLLVLDDMRDDAFRELCEGVASVRVRRRLDSKDDTPSFDVVQMLGKLDLNALLQRILGESVDPDARKLEAEAQALAATPFFAEKYVDEAKDPDAEVDTSEALPFYQAYLIRMLHLRVPLPQDPQWERRRQDSREIRKKMVAAYLSICHELKANVRYASADMVLQMSDHCVRDFISQLDEIFRATELPLSDFLTRQVPVPIQDRALKRASQKKRDSLPKSGVTAPIETGRIVHGLALVTAAIQTHDVGKRHLSSSERGLFVVRATESRAEGKPSIPELLRDAGEAGFLRLLDTEGETWKFRVHTSLAAAYGFSYRGAYYDCPLRIADIKRLREADDLKELDSIASEIARRMPGDDPDNRPLFKTFTT